MPRERRPQSRIYLDCDGVLADFEKGAAGVLGMPSRAFEQRYGIRDFWARLASTPDFFDTLDLLPDAMELYEAVRHRDLVILTGLPRGAWAEPQKRRWAARHFPGVEVITTTSALKREHCHPGDVLVDDTVKFRHLWEKEAASSSRTGPPPARSRNCAGWGSWTRRRPEHWRGRRRRR